MTRLFDPAEVQAQIATDYENYIRLGKDFAAGHEIYQELLETREEKSLRVGWPKFDLLTGGIRAGELTIATGDTGHGKSLLGQNLLFWFLCGGHKCCCFSLEMGPFAMIRGMVPMVKAIVEENEPAPDFGEWIKKAPLIMFRGSGGMNSTAFLESIVWAAMSEQCEFIFIDHFHCLVDPSWDAAKIEALIRDIRGVADQLNVAIFCIVHPAKMPPKGGEYKERRTEMNELKGSSGLKQYADNVYSIFFDKENRLTEVYLHKIRHPDYGANVGTSLIFKLNLDTRCFEQVENANGKC